tara:strand:- start:670 stop:849 length:180 start_codon:yes stop_codon:yes gene_type:complete
MESILIKKIKEVCEKSNIDAEPMERLLEKCIQGEISESEKDEVIEKFVDQIKKSFEDED